MSTELAIAKKIIEENTRLSIVILDNLVELYLFDHIQDNAMFDYLERDKNDAKYRLGLYSNFNEKIKYAIDKKIIDKLSGELFSIFHKIRNNLYHKSDNIEISKHLAEYYFAIVEKLIDTNNSKSTFKYNQSSEITQYFKSNLQNRFLNFRANVAESCASTRDFDSLDLTDAEINDCMDHVFSNYGENVIEKSNLKKDLKELYINKFIQYQESENLFFKIQKLYSLEKRVKKYAWDEDLKSLKLWYEIDNEFKVYEEIVELYVLIAC